LHEEADYLREARQMQLYADRLADDPRFLVPRPLDDWTTDQVLVMDYIAADSIDTLADASQDVRDRSMAALLDLVLHELFVFGHMQTDPNFANYRWRPESGEIVLLDFGAARPVPPETTNAYRTLLRAGLTGDRDGLRAALIDVGFVSPALVARHGAALDAMIDTIIAHVLRPGLFDFADRSFVARLREQATPVVADTASWHLPPVETMFVQRKVSGTALLAVRMQARLPLVDMVAGMVAPD
jgi:predicted unusual protein kinase regulating ubiquinone biosynthesis (AarF/ABC1/UbiB family)